MSTTIEYLDETINPIQDTRKGKSGRGYHCTKCSPGCQNCWAEAMNMRFGNGQPFDDTPAKFEIIESELDKLRKWKKHRYTGVHFMGDMYHPDIDEWINSYVYSELYVNSQHTYLLLTKRPELMQTFFLGRNIPPHIHGGLTICNQQEADEKIPIFLQIPFTTHVLSIEPMLGPVDLRHYLGPIITNAMKTLDARCGHHGNLLHGKACPACFPNVISQCIVGGESGPRPMHPDWIRSVRNQCQETGTLFFFKQWGEWIPKLFYYPKTAKNIHGWGTLDIDGNWFPVTTPWNGKQGEDSETREYVMYKVGKKYAGRLLDGREWNERP